jgi:hypothetical protein
MVAACGRGRSFLRPAHNPPSHWIAATRGLDIPPLLRKEGNDGLVPRRAGSFSKSAHTSRMDPAISPCTGTCHAVRDITKGWQPVWTGPSNRCAQRNLVKPCVCSRKEAEPDHILLPSHDSLMHSTIAVQSATILGTENRDDGGKKYTVFKVGALTRTHCVLLSPTFTAWQPSYPTPPRPSMFATFALCVVGPLPWDADGDQERFLTSPRRRRWNSAATLDRKP